MKCSNCGSENPADSALCEQCGQKLELFCPACKAPISAGARFCRKCGTSLSATSMGSEAIAARPSSGAGIRLLAQENGADVTDGERKTVTALFADIKGSMELLEDLDPEEARAIVDPALKLMIDTVRRYGGYIVQSTGTVSLRYSGRQLRTRTIPSARCMRRSGCRMISAASLNGCARKKE